MRNLLLLASFASLLGACQPAADAHEDKFVELADRGDSLSFAVGMLVAEQMPAAMIEFGIDSTTVDDFMRGLCDAFPTDGSPESMAYAQGVVMAASAMEMLEEADKAIYPDGNGKKVDRSLYLEGLKASAYASGKTMSIKAAKEYYNKTVFCSVSEEFMRNNKERPGVVTLPSGVQYKVEQMGSGRVPAPASVVSCVYKGRFPNGAVFDSSRGQAVDLPVNSVVAGLSEVLTTLPEGTSCVAYIPWQLAYGAGGGGNIPPYSALVYELEIVKILDK